MDVKRKGKVVVDQKQEFDCKKTQKNIQSMFVDKKQTTVVSYTAQL